MTSVTVSVTDIIPANHEQVYSVIADYHKGHQAILPRPAFQEMKVLEGGYGAGTRIYIHTKMWGISNYYDQIVEEPEPGRVLIERDVNTEQYTTFTFEPLSDTQTRVTIASVMPLSKGIRGAFERVTLSPVARKLFKTELQNLADYVRQPDYNLQVAT